MFGFSVIVGGGSGRLISWLIFSICLLVCVAPASAQDVACVFLSPAKPLIAGTQCSLWLYCMNSSSGTAERTFTPQLRGELIAGSRTLDIVLSLNTTNSGADALIIP